LAAWAGGAGAGFGGSGLAGCAGAGFGGSGLAGCAGAVVAGFEAVELLALLVLLPVVL